MMIQNKTTEFYRGFSFFFVALRLAVFFSVLILPFISCQSAPDVSNPFIEETNILPLDSGASAYIFANVQEARPILDVLPIEELKEKQAKQILDKTDFIAAAVFPKADAANTQDGESASAADDKRYQLAAWGSYPGSKADFAFTFSKGWKKQRSAKGYNYWHSAANKLSIAMNSKQAFVVVSEKAREPSTALSPGTAAEIPEGFAEFRRQSGKAAPLSCWLENPGPVIDKALKEAGVPVRFPVQKLFINLYQQPASGAFLQRDMDGRNLRYEAIIRLQLESVSQARGLAALLNLAAGFFSTQNRNETADNEEHGGSQDSGNDSIMASLFMANPPVQNGRSLDFKTAPLSENELSLLLKMFLL